MRDFDHVKDSGTRQEFSTGAVRDAQSGKGRYDLVLSLTHMIYRLARHFENGAVKYGDDNWRKGLPLRRFIDSAFRHLCQYANGEEGEDHLTAAIWNLMCHGETKNEIEAGRLPAELADMPHYARQPKSGIVLDEIGKPVLFAGKEIIYNTAVDPAEEGGGVMVRNPLMEAAPEAVEPKHYYVAGPMRGIPFCNFPLFDRVTEVARAQGLDVTSPAELDRDHGIDPVTDPNSVDDAFVADPNLTQTLAQRDCGVILNLEKDRRDGLILLPDWPKSIGARAEVALALWLGLTFKGVVINPTVHPTEITLYDISVAEIEILLFYQLRG